MVLRCSGKLLILFFSLQLLLLFILVNVLNLRSQITVTQTEPPCKCNERVQMIHQLQEQLKNLQAELHKELENKHSTPGPTRYEIRNEENVKKRSVSLPRPEKDKLANDINLFAELVTIILYRRRTTVSLSCFKTRQSSLLKMFPNIQVLSDTLNASTVGSTFNFFIPRVHTKYFLFLDCQHELFPQTSDHSSGWLLHALENIPELDFISGSILDRDQLEIPCYRLVLCNWTLNERYEYERSIDELMICQNIAPSFMGRTTSIERIFSNKTIAFDEKMMAMSITDFFIRAKKAGALSGIRPEVMFKVSQDSECNTNVTENRRDYFLALLPFAHKYKVFRFAKADSHTLDLCGHDSPILGQDICDEPIAHKVMLDGEHWASVGTYAYPFIVNNLQSCLFKVAEFLESKGIQFSIDGGVALGAVKIRGLLPWDSGDIDMLVYYERGRNAFYEVLSKYAKDHNFAAFNTHFEAIELFCFPPEIAWKVGGIVTIFVHTEKSEAAVKIKTNGRWIPYHRLFYYHRKYYKSSYLQHRAFGSNEMMHCKKNGHNACLPDFRKLEKLGKTGTFREFFACET